MKKPIVIMTSDHAGFALKQTLSGYLSGKHYSVIDIGPDSLKKTDDYPLYAREGARAVKDTLGAFGVFVCGSGVGMNIVANRYKGIRAVQAESLATVTRARREDNANVLVLGSRIVPQDRAKKMILAFLQTSFSKQTRHSRRIRLIDRIV